MSHISRKVIFLLSFSLLIFSKVDYVVAQSTDMFHERLKTKIEPDTTINLEKDLLYEQFTVSNTYLTWLEYYTKKLFFLDLSNNEIKSVQLTEGRGPKEYLSIVGLSIKDDVAHIMDAQNLKIIRYDLNRKVFLDDLQLRRPLIGLVESNNSLYGMEISPEVTNGFFFEIKESKILSLENSNISTNPYGDEFNYMGKFISNNRYLARISVLINEIILYDIEKQYVDKFQYDEYLEKPSLNRNSAGSYTVPINLKMKLIDADLFSDSSVLLIVGEGATKNKKFKKNQIHYYDLSEKKYLPRIDTLNIDEIHDIEVNDSKLIVYDKLNSNLIIHSLW